MPAKSNKEITIEESPFHVGEAQRAYRGCCGIQATNRCPVSWLWRLKGSRDWTLMACDP